MMKAIPKLRLPALQMAGLVGTRARHALQNHWNLSFENNFRLK